jgi:hypothetical protein
MVKCAVVRLRALMARLISNRPIHIYEQGLICILALLGSPLERSKYLTSFQQDKFVHMFNTWFQPYGMQTITMANIHDWVEKIRIHSSLKKDDKTNTRNLDMFTVLFESLVDQARQERGEMKEI